VCPPPTPEYVYPTIVQDSLHTLKSGIQDDVNLLFKLISTMKEHQTTPPMPTPTPTPILNSTATPVIPMPQPTTMPLDFNKSDSINLKINLPDVHISSTIVESSNTNKLKSSIPLVVQYPMDSYSISIRSEYPPVTGLCSQCHIFPNHILKAHPPLIDGSYLCLPCNVMILPSQFSDVSMEDLGFLTNDLFLLNQYFDVFRFTQVTHHHTGKYKSTRAKNSPHTVDTARTATKYRTRFYHDSLQDCTPLWIQFISTFDPKIQPTQPLFMNSF